MTYSRSKTLFPPKVRSQIRILIVADGSIHFVEHENGNGFSLTELINKALLPSALPWEDIRITTARRINDSDRCANIQNFRFDIIPARPYNYPFTIEHYDQVWLFGYERQEPDKVLKDSELKVLFDFMNAGGGVFATGDHENIGFALCGKVPRVRSMRKWYYDPVPLNELRAPGRNDATRIDTLREGIDFGFQPNDQCDSIPQEIRPKFFLNPTGKGSHPHPLLADGNFAITVLPDHMHEGECVIPTDLTRTISFDGAGSFEEYPTLPGSETRLAPEVVAISTSAGGYLLSETREDLLPVEPRCYNVIVAYDGHQIERIENGQTVTLGRVVVDASFHHFLDINLKGTDSDHPQKKGFYDSQCNPTKDYQAFKKYFRNILTWLCPPNLVIKHYQSLLLDLRYRSPLIEELPPIPDPNFDIIYAGTVTRLTITERFSHAEAIECARSIASMLSDKNRLELERLINPWLPSALRTSRSNTILDSDVLLDVVLGGAVLEIANNLPLDLGEAGQRLVHREASKEMLPALISKGLGLGVNALKREIEGASKTLDDLSAMLAEIS